MSSKKPSKKKRTSKKPTSNGDLAVLIEGLRDDVRQMAEGLTLLDQKVETHHVEVTAEIQDKFSILSEAVAQNREDLTVLKQDVSVLKQDVSILKQDVREIRQEITETREELRGDIRLLREEFHTHTHSSS